MAELTPKQQKFVDEYLIDLNATQAAIRAGYSQKGANVAASQLLSNINVSKVIELKRNKVSEKAGLSAEYVLTSLHEVAERCMQSKPVLDNKGNATGQYKFDSAGANKALELLGKYYTLFKDKVEHTGAAGGPIEFTWKRDDDGASS